MSDKIEGAKEDQKQPVTESDSHVGLTGETLAWASAPQDNWQLVPQATRQALAMAERNRSRGGRQ